MSLPGAILILRSNCGLNDEAIALVNGTLDLRHILYSSAWAEWKDKLDELKGDFVLNFLSDRILKGAILERRTVNFHPAPPEYPGRCTASYAIFDDAGTFGATAHRMAAKPDSGPILKVKRFPITAHEGCESVARRAESACLELLREIIFEIRTTGELPPPSGESWARAAFTREHFDKWLILDQTDQAVFEKKITAAKHPRYPGPYVYIHGHRFRLNDE